MAAIRTESDIPGLTANDDLCQYSVAWQAHQCHGAGIVVDYRQQGAIGTDVNRGAAVAGL